jgi:hypothetical protein
VSPFERFVERVVLVLIVWTVLYLTGHLVVALLRGTL